MALVIDYYFAPQSPWAYLGHARFSAIAKEAGASVRVLPVDYGQIFPASGGLPLPKRAPQRQAYRLVELARFSQHLGVPLNLQPKFFPVAADPAAKLITAVALAEGDEAAMRLSAEVFASVWAREQDIADAATLASLLQACGLSAQRLEESQGDTVAQAYQRHTDQALAAGVFGAPSYVVRGEVFWGQDRLDFLQRRLRQDA